MISQARLKELLHYNHESGVFTWLVNRQPGIRIGDVAGTLRSDGYIRIQLDGVRLYASHWAWLYMTGNLPDDEVDHEDRNRANNAWLNLRPATKSQNCANRPKSGRKTSNLPRGVATRGKKFVSQICVRGEPRYLGIYDTPEAAHAAYSREAIKEFGEFSVVAANDNTETRAAA